MHLVKRNQLKKQPNLAVMLSSEALVTSLVILAKAGIQWRKRLTTLDPCLRRDDASKFCTYLNRVVNIAFF